MYFLSKCAPFFQHIRCFQFIFVSVPSIIFFTRRWWTIKPHIKYNTIPNYDTNPASSVRVNVRRWRYPRNVEAAAVWIQNSIESKEILTTEPENKVLNRSFLSRSNYCPSVPIRVRVDRENVREILKTSAMLFIYFLQQCRRKLWSLICSNKHEWTARETKKGRWKFQTFSR